MTEYKSEVKTVYAPQEAVYGKLSDMSNLAVVRQHMDDPEVMRRIQEQAGDRVSPEQLKTIMEQLHNLKFDRDSVTGSTMLGNITLCIVDREEPKTIKFELQGAPVAANLWIQLLPENDMQCAMRLTAKADLNFFIRQMVGSKLQQGVDALATMLASIPY